MIPSDCSRLRSLDDRSVTRPATGSGRDWPGLNRITGRAGLPRVFREDTIIPGSVVPQLPGLHVFCRYNPPSIRLHRVYVIVFTACT